MNSSSPICSFREEILPQAWDSYFFEELACEEYRISLWLATSWEIPLVLDLNVYASLSETCPKCLSLNLHIFGSCAVAGSAADFQPDVSKQSSACLAFVENAILPWLSLRSSHARHSSKVYAIRNRLWADLEFCPSAAVSTDKNYVFFLVGGFWGTTLITDLEGQGSS